MIIPRIKQIIDYIFFSYKSEWDKEIKEILQKNEFLVFDKMDEYDKIHCYKKYKIVKNSKILKKDINYLKLALLHDCGKNKMGLLRRLKKVLIGDSLLEQHPEIGYQKIKNINKEVADLIKIHHDIETNDKMKEFQRIDDLA